MKHILYTLFAASLLTLAGCGGSDPAPAPAPASEEAPAPEAGGETAEQSAEDKLMDVAKAVAATPADAERILSEAGMSIEQFEAAMFELAKDPAKAEKFAASMM